MLAINIIVITLMGEPSTTNIQQDMKKFLPDAIPNLKTTKCLHVLHHHYTSRTMPERSSEHFDMLYIVNDTQYIKYQHNPKKLVSTILKKNKNTIVRRMKRYKRNDMANAIEPQRVSTPDPQ